MLYLPLDADEALYESLLDQYRPVLFLALERCGINAEGDYQNMSGASIRAYTAPVDQMFARAQGRMLTIGAVSYTHLDVYKRQDYAIRYGFQRYQTDATIVTVIILLVLITIVQSIGNLLTRKMQ